MKIRAVGAELLDVDRQIAEWTNRHDKANSCFSKICERAKNLSKKCFTLLLTCNYFNKG
jgi:hypothetical protein